MSPLFQTAFLNTHSSCVRSRSFRVWSSAHIWQINVVTFSVLILLGFAYIFQVNSTASKGYTMRELETRIQELTVANQQIETEVNEAQSLSRISRAVKMIGMVKAEAPVYVNAGSPSVAFAK